MSQPLTLEEFEHQGSARMPPDVRDYIGGGAGREQTLAASRAAFDRFALRPRVLVDVRAPDLSVRLLGTSLAAPIGVAPMAFHRLVHPDGEQATARAAGAAGALFVTSIFASQSLEDIAAAASGPLWLQLYWLRRREALADLAQRAEAAGYRALMLTVDAARVARRLRDVRNSFSVPPHIRAVNLDAALPEIAAYGAAGISAIEAHSRDQFDAAVTWRDLEWLTSRTRLPLVLKGVLTAQDALLAAEHGAAAVVVSNHGGRQLDAAVPGLIALPEITDAVAHRIPVLFDGGVRCGADAAKALALGARIVLVGRPVLWGLACAGRDGAAAVLKLLRDELEEVMVLSGRPKLADFGRDAVVEL
ncbi:alpha-hydroxy-acid oxidizing protein [Actinocrinis puniceicyclus]|uniref:Alpha-hydroxy-acid oxidizing protein n=1 Tax=Actinocrinis puniceicyclus TaxID=977794 RepID=A0A8J7WPG5_9ACTN|nr:alpha-hydroxy acid oxidase [Actinocrinis puniceicyclus]MBS2964430.1 alpha-hydroxy-acid oxidizing protein [Actinocrinis puniceicyclus]